MSLSQSFKTTLKFLALKLFKTFTARDLEIFTMSNYYELITFVFVFTGDVLANFSQAL